MGKSLDTADAQVDLFHFVQAANEMTSLVYVGIDPGASGAIGWLCGSEYCVTDIPTITIKRGNKNRTEPDLPGILQLFNMAAELTYGIQRIKVLLEQCPVSAGRGSSYADVIINRHCAIWPLFIMSKQWSFADTDTRWKKAMGLTLDKELSRRNASRLFPDAPLVRVADHNRAEALLLAEYHRRTTRGKL